MNFISMCLFSIKNIQIKTGNIKPKMSRYMVQLEIDKIWILSEFGCIIVGKREIKKVQKIP